MCHNNIMVALVSRTCQKGSMATSSGQKTWNQSSDHLSVILEPYCAICTVANCPETGGTVPKVLDMSRSCPEIPLC